MNLTLMLLLPLVALILISAPLYPIYKGTRTGVKARRSVYYHLAAFGGIFLLALIMPIGGLVSAAEAETAAAVASSATGLGYLAAALVTGLSGIGGGIAVASAAPAAIGAVSEDPKSFGKAMIFVVFGEGIAIYGLLISILILSRL